jgi:hypothetical protein
MTDVSELLASHRLDGGGLLMGSYNVVEDVAATCPRCGAGVSVGVQFKFGGTWQHRYVIGDVLRWDGNNIGRPGRSRVVVDGVSDSACPVCGYDDDWDFYVFVEHDRIARVTAADGTHDFIGAGTTYLELGD